jgi:hypothetical protein
MNKNVQTRQIAEYKEKASRDAAKVDQLWAGLDDDVVVKEVSYTSRYEVPPPEPRDKSKYNPATKTYITLSEDKKNYILRKKQREI